MRKRKTDTTRVVSVRMPIYMHEFLKKQAKKNRTNVNSLILSYIQAAACIQERMSLLEEFEKELRGKEVDEE